MLDFDNPETLTHAEVSRMVGRPITVQEANAFRLDIGGSLADLYEAQLETWG